MSGGYPSPTKAESFVRKFATAFGFLTAFLWLFWIPPHLTAESNTLPYSVLAAALLLLLLSAWAAKPRLPGKGKWVTSFAVTLVLYWLTEAGFYLFAGSGQGSSAFDILECNPMYNHPCAVLDTTIGYRWKEGTHRIALITGGEVIYDSRFTANKQGFISRFDFDTASADTGEVRIAVFGDSFTSGIFLEENWVEKLQKKVDAAYPGKRIVLLNFAIDGGGTENWYRLWFYEVMNRYAPHAVLIAVAENDLERDFIMHHQQDSLCLNHYFNAEKFPRTLEGFITAIPRTGSNFLPFICPDAEMDSLVQNPAPAQRASSGKFTLPLFRYLNDLMAVRKMESGYQSLISSGQSKKYIWADVVNDLGKGKAERLHEMVSSMTGQNRKVILVSVPGLFEMKESLEGKPVKKALQMQWLADNFRLPLYDGRQIFSGVQLEGITAHYFRYDFHWNQKGSDLFAEKFSEFVLPHLRTFAIQP